MEHLTLTVHYYIQVTVESALVAIEPFDIFQLGVFVEHIEEAVTEASGGDRKSVV